MEESSAEGSDAPSERQLEYAWRWFEFHANQRTKIFNYMIVSCAILVAAYSDAIESHHFSAFTIALVGMLFSFCFGRLDRRNRELIWLSEDVLRELEKDFIFKSSTMSFSRSIDGHKKLFRTTRSILTRDAHDCVDGQGIGFRDITQQKGYFSSWFHVINSHKGEEGRLWRKQFVCGHHRFWFPFVSSAFLMLFFVFLIVSIIAMFSGAGGAEIERSIGET
ncbi:MAG: hypothetical protein KDA64_03495 [Rhodospirillaceae bacterium]|nr:hypothetical protein [Rhodospirillaceae bacterium]